MIELFLLLSQLKLLLPDFPLQVESQVAFLAKLGLLRRGLNDYRASHSSELESFLLEHEIFDYFVFLEELILEHLNLGFLPDILVLQVVAGHLLANYIIEELLPVYLEVVVLRGSYSADLHLDIVGVLAIPYLKAFVVAACERPSL